MDVKFQAQPSRLSKITFSAQAFPAVSDTPSTDSQNNNIPNSSDLDLIPLEIHPKAFIKGIKTFLPIIVDTGASLCVTHDKNDFVTPLTSSSIPRQLGGLAHGLSISGKGLVNWTFISDSGKILRLIIEVYYVPSAGVRLLSPQSLFQQGRHKGRFVLDQDKGLLLFDQDKLQLSLPLNPQNNLPMIYGLLGQEVTGRIAELNLAVEAEQTQNLTMGQLTLLRWHNRLGHVNMATVQLLLKSGALGNSKDIRSASNCEPPKCASCIYGKQARRPTGATTTKPVASTIGTLKSEDLFPGQRVSMDHFICSSKGRLYSSHGKSSERDMYSGGCIFVDHASGYIHVEHQVTFTAAHTLQSKHRFERKLRNLGVIVLAYQSDNGTFSAAEFVEEIHRNKQEIRFSGVGAHHQNGVAERAIGTIMRLARTMMLHAAIRWPEVADPSLWPMAVDYAVHLYDHLPTLGPGVAPIDFLTRTMTPRHHLQNMHVWGCPAYVLDPTLQDGKKIPRWKPRSRRAIFVGLSPVHAHTVPLVLSCATLAISPQFHVVFDDWFTTTTSQKESDEAPDWWGDLLDKNRFRYAFDDENLTVDEEAWLKAQEVAFTRYSQQRERVDQTQILPLPQDKSGKQQQTVTDQAVDATMQNPSTTTSVPTSEPARDEINIEPTVDQSKDSGQDHLLETSTSNVIDTTTLNQGNQDQETKNVSLRRSDRVRRPPQRYGFDDYQAYSFISPEAYIIRICQDIKNLPSQREQRLLYDKLLCQDFDANLLDETPTVSCMLASSKDPDTLCYHEAVLDKDWEGFKEAMLNEIRSLESFDTWEIIPRCEATNRVLPSTWTFRRKRSPDGNVRKLKARFCVRGDKQIAGVDYFESYAPVVSWSTVRLMLTLSLAFNLQTRQVDYVNAFAQGDLQEKVFVELPQGFQAPANGDYVLRLRKSLYGLVQSPRAFFLKLSSALESRKFAPSKLDPCLFIHQDMVCLVYVDDCLFFAKDSTTIDAMIKSLKADFRLEEEGEVSAFLGIDITNLPNGGGFKLLQRGLKHKVIDYVGLSNCNPDTTPAALESLGSDQDGKPFNEAWNYASAVGMLLYLSANSHPEISYAVHQCARFTHNPRVSHGKAIKRICRYLRGALDDGLIIQPTQELSVDCYVDADFAGLWGTENKQDPSCVKSRTGFVLLVAGCPVAWVSKLQTEIALSTLEAEYIALSQAMRDILPTRVVVKEIANFLQYNNTIHFRAHSDVFEDNNGALTLANVP
jgi:hypothetical protein